MTSIRFSRLAAIAFSLIAVTSIAQTQASAAHADHPSAHPQVHDLKVTVLSTMLVGTQKGIGEWGFAALVEADGHRILVDTGARPETVLQNARELGIDLSTVKEVVLTHNHGDHAGGLVTLRRELMKKNPDALSVVHVGKGTFYSRPSADGEGNDTLLIRKEYEATSGKFVEHAEGFEIFPGVWFSGPVPRKYPERNWSMTGKVQTPEGLVEDTVPEDSSLVLNTPRGLVVVTGCGHAGIVNIMTYATASYADEPVYAVVGGIHLFPASDQQLEWTADEFKQFHVANLLGAHCTGIEAVYRLRDRAGMSRKSAVVGTVGSTFTLNDGIAVGALAK
jgi:7,8-dihydropterin-6-yl-methyl-4-(beta-D-ribofuranosyl)aminobenzene 5'-phosphate synthase